VRTFILLTILLASTAVAQAVDSGEMAGEIDVSGNADAKMMQQDLKDITTTVLPCLIQASGDGKSDADAESYCFCKNRTLVESRLAELRNLRSKHAEWNGKTFKIVSGPTDDRETHRFGDPQIAEIETSLSQASKTCE